MNTRAGKTTRMIDYAIGAARQGRKIAIIAHDDKHRDRLYEQIGAAAKAAGCPWVVGSGAGGYGQNIEVYSITGYLVYEPTPGQFELRGSRDREVLVDNYVIEQKYSGLVDNYLRWL